MSSSGCNYVLHSSGQLFSHKRKHERRLYEYGEPCKQPKLIASIETSSEAAASDCDDVRIVMSTSSTATMTSPHGIDIQPSPTWTTATTDSVMSCATATTAALQGSSFSMQPSESSLTTVSKPNISQQVPSTSFNVPEHDTDASSSTATVARHTNEIGESMKQGAVASTAVDTDQPEMNTKIVDLSATRPSPALATTVDDDCLFITRSSPSQVRPLVNVMKQSISLGLSNKAHSDDMKLEKLKKKEYVDLEDLAKMTKFKQIAEEEKTGLELQQSLAQDTTTANSTSGTVPSATKPLRSGNEKKERDDSWQKYIKRSGISLSGYNEKNQLINEYFLRP